jgi:hypothetical protein
MCYQRRNLIGTAELHEYQTRFDGIIVGINMLKETKLQD